MQIALHPCFVPEAERRAICALRQSLWEQGDLVTLEFIRSTEEIEMLTFGHGLGIVAVLGLLAGLSAGCSSNPHKAEKIETKIEKADQISGDTKLGVKDGNMVVQRKVLMNEELRSLQNDVYELEDRVYGNRKYGSLGLYGVLRDCRTQLADKDNGGSGKLQWTEPLDRVTDKEDEFKIGVDEKEKLVGVSEEMLKDRIERFRGYKSVLQKRQDEYEEKVAICKNELKNRKADKGSN